MKEGEWGVRGDLGIKKELVRGGVGVLFDKVKEILNMRWFESERFGEWEGVIEKYLKLCCKNMRILLNLIGGSEGLPNTSGNGEMDPLEADNVNILAFLKPIFGELGLVTESFSRQRQFLEEEKKGTDADAARGSGNRKSSGV